MQRRDVLRVQIIPLERIAAQYRYRVQRQIIRVVPRRRALVYHTGYHRWSALKLAVERQIEKPLQRDLPIEKTVVDHLSGQLVRRQLVEPSAVYVVSRCRQTDIRERQPAEIRIRIPLRDDLRRRRFRRGFRFFFRRHLRFRRDDPRVLPRFRCHTAAARGQKECSQQQREYLFFHHVKSSR